MRKGLLALMGLCLVLALAVNCGGDNGDDGNGDPKDTKEETPAEVAEEVEIPSGECAGLPDLTGKVYRVTEMNASHPTDKVNEVWNNDIGTCDLVILFHITEHNLETNVLQVEVTSAWADKTLDGEGNCVPKSYEFALEPAIMVMTIDGCAFDFSQKFDLNIVTPTVSKPFHVFGVTGDGIIAEDGSDIPYCKLSGLIAEEETYDLCLQIPGLGTANFHWFMNLAGICPNADSDNDGDIDSYYFEGILKATEENQYFKAGTIHPIESLVEECPLDSEECI